MPRDCIQKRDGEKKKTAAQQTENQITQSGYSGLRRILRHDESAGCNGIQLQEHISGKQVVGKDESKHTGQKKIQHDEIKISLLPGDFLAQIARSTQYGTQHNKAEYSRHQRFKGAGAQFVSPRCAEASQRIAERDIFCEEVGEHPQVHGADQSGDSHMKAPCRLAF